MNRPDIEAIEERAAAAREDVSVLISYIHKLEGLTPEERRNDALMRSMKACFIRTMPDDDDEFYGIASGTLHAGEDIFIATHPDWQPIETAPRDGTQVLVWGGFSYVAWFDDDLWTDGPNCALRPTHWMPLPEPPAQEGSR